LGRISGRWGSLGFARQADGDDHADGKGLAFETEMVISTVDISSAAGLTLRVSFAGAGAQTLQKSLHVTNTNTGVVTYGMIAADIAAGPVATNLDKYKFFQRGQMFVVHNRRPRPGE